MTQPDLDHAPPVAPARPERGLPGLRAAVTATIAFGLVFIVRASTVVDGERTFTLFDDAMVSMRYAHDLARGDGLVWNAGQPGVEGYTNFLWTLWLTVLHLTGLPIRLMGAAVSLSGLALLVAGLVVVAHLCRRIAPGRRMVSWAALALTATCYPLLYWTLRGMEVGLVAVVLSASALCASKVGDDERAVWWLAVLGVVGVLTRTDVIVPIAVIGAYAVLVSPRAARWRTGVLAGGPVIAALGVQTALRLRWYGEALPNTYALKLGGVPLSTRLQRGSVVAVLLLTLEVLAPAILAVVALRASAGGERRCAWLCVSVFASCVAYATFVGGDAWEWMRIPDRYVAPALPLLFVAAALGFDHLLARTPSPGAFLRAGAVLTGGAVLAQADVFPHDLLQLGPRDTTIFTGALLAAAGLAFGTGLWLGSRPRHDGAVVRRVTTAAALAALVVATAGPAFAGWLSTGGAHVDDDATMAAIARAIDVTTTPTTSIAVVWAGSVPYFSDRPAVDLLGKSDPVIARSPLHDGAFQPGHMRWDYAYSIGTLRPDLVIGLWSPTQEDEADLVSWGYDRVVGEVWVRRDATGIDVPALRARLAGLHAPTVN